MGRFRGLASRCICKKAAAVSLISCKLIGAFDHDFCRSVGIAEGDSIRSKERRDTGQNDFFKARLDQITDMDHALAKLGRAIDWRFLEERSGAVYSDKPGQPPLPTRLMAGLSILKHTHDLSDEDLCARWVENPYFQLFCDGMDGPGACAMLALYGLTSEGIRYVHHRNHWAGYREERVSG